MSTDLASSPLTRKIEVRVKKILPLTLALSRKGRGGEITIEVAFRIRFFCWIRVKSLKLKQ
jgi:hypothetical protein